MQNLNEIPENSPVIVICGLFKISRGDQMIKNSVIKPCADCKKDVLLSPSSQDLIKKVKNALAMCWACASLHAEKEKEMKFQVAPGMIEECLEEGFVGEAILGTLIDGVVVKKKDGAS